MTFQAGGDQELSAEEGRCFRFNYTYMYILTFIFVDIYYMYYSVIFDIIMLKIILILRVPQEAIISRFLGLLSPTDT